MAAMAWYLSYRSSGGTVMHVFATRESAVDAACRLVGAIDPDAAECDEPVPSILLLEDVADGPSGLAERLSDFGYPVFLASDAGRACDLLGNEKVDLILADGLMAGGRGASFAAQARRLGIPAVLITSDPDVYGDLTGEAFPTKGKRFSFARLQEAICRAMKP